MLSFSFNVHMSKVFKNRGILIKLISLPRSILLSFFHQYIHIYIIVSRPNGGNYASTIQHFFILQKKIIRLIYGIPYYESSAPAFYNLGILKLSDIYRYFSLLYFFKVLYNNKSPIFLRHILQQQIVHSHGLRSHLYRLPRVHVYKYKRSPV